MQSMGGWSNGPGRGGARIIHGVGGLPATLDGTVATAWVVMLPLLACGRDGSPASIRPAERAGTRGPTLERLRTVELAADEQVRGAAFGPKSSIVYWTAHSVVTLSPDLTTRQPVCSRLLSKPIAAAFGSGAEVVEVVDASGVLIIGRGDRCRRVQLKLGGRLESAAHLPTGWVALVRRPQTETPGLVWLQGGRRPLIPPVWPDLKGRDSDWLFVTATGGTLVAGLARAPFWWMHSAPNADEQRARNWVLTEPNHPIAFMATDERAIPAEPIHPLDLLSSGPDPAWVGLSVLSTKFGFLQTLADLKSETRLLVTYDQGGRVVRRARIGTPLGLVASEPASDLVVGYASLRRPTLILYRLTGAAP